MSESGANFGSTMQPTSDLKKPFKTAEELKNTNTDVKTYPSPEAQKPKGIKAVLSLFMTRKEAEAAGVETLNLFNQFNFNEGSSSYIDYVEFGKYEHGDKNTNVNKAKLKQFNNLKPEDQLRVFTKHAFKEVGMSDQLTKIFKTARKNNKKQDLQSLAQNKYNLDLSQYKTKEEQTQALVNAINTKYSTNTTDKKSVYMTNLERLRAGKFTEVERKQLNGKKSIKDEEQLQKYAEAATNKEQILELAELFANGDNDTKEALISTIGSYNSDVQIGILGIGILSAKDKNTRELFATTLADQKDIKLTDKNQKLFDYSISVLMNNVDAQKGIQFYTNASHFETKNAQTSAFMNYDTAQQSKVERGEITQQEYNDNYANQYAASAHKLEEASKAYKYVIDNSNDDNREGAMSTLASTAYDIKDSSERDKAIGNLKNSEYYNDKTSEKLDESAQKYLADKANNDSSNNVVSQRLQNQTYQTVPTIYNKQDISDTISKVITSGDETATNELIEHTFDNLNEKNGTTPKRQRMGMNQGVQLLNELIKDDKLQGSVHEAKVLNKLKALSTPTLRNLFIKLNSKTQQYFIDKKIISYSDLEFLTRSDERMLSQRIQDNLEKHKEEKHQNEIETIS